MKEKELQTQPEYDPSISDDSLDWLDLSAHSPENNPLNRSFNEVTL